MKQTYLLLLCVFILSSAGTYSQTFCTEDGSDQVEGEQDGYRYELWNQFSKGKACMTLGEGALFRGEWSGIHNYLARRGLLYDETQEHKEIGTFIANYKCDYNPIPDKGGNSYLSIYGWTVDPLVEYYIVEDWMNWIPSMAKDSKLTGTIEVNGSIYDIYKTMRINQPSIKGTSTFPQYFSIRRNTRNEGTINISDHFNKWEELGLEMGKMYEVSYVVEGYKSNGSFSFKELEIVVK